MTARDIPVVLTEAAAGARLDKALADALAADGLSRSRVQALIAEGRVLRACAPVADASARARPGEAFLVRVPDAEAATPAAQEIPLSVLHEDDDLLVVDKPAGLVVHPAPGNPDRTLVNALLAHCGDRLSGVGGVRRPGIVHRLDKDTSGLMVVAKTDRAHAALSAQFADRTLSRTYLAVVRGLPSPTEGEVEGPIGRDPRDRKRMAVTPGGKPALTRYLVLAAAGAEAAVVECRLATGRTHQIRVHMASIGHPLAGDPLYGRRPRGRGRGGDEALRAALAAFPRQALHAAGLRFRHPADGAVLSFDAPPPADLAALMALVGRGAGGDYKTGPRGSR
jgi:23S rRNA pseudouridine1911/1915/1917 synthase